MKIYGVIGWKNAGKTSLMERLVAEIRARGHTVSTIKHAHHAFDLDHPGKDSHRHRAAGAREVLLASLQALGVAARDSAMQPEPPMSEMLTKLAPADLVLVEGYKRDTHAKVEVFRAEAGHALIQPDDPTVRAVATDIALDGLSVPVFDLDDTVAIADFILAETGLGAPDRGVGPGRRTIASQPQGRRARHGRRDAGDAARAHLVPVTGVGPSSVADADGRILAADVSAPAGQPAGGQFGDGRLRLRPCRACPRRAARLTLSPGRCRRRGTFRATASRPAPRSGC